MKIEQRGSELHISLPFSMKDSFKTVFRSAKWNPDSRTWYVSTRSRSKLEAWVKAAEETGAALSAEDFDALDATERDIERMTADLASLKLRIDAERAKRSDIEEKRAENAKLLKRIEEMKADLAAAAAETAAADAAEKAETASIEAVVGSLINLNSLRHNHRQMIREARQGATSKGRDKFDAHSSEIFEALKTLRKNGIDSEQMRILANANYNRKHKDLDDWDQPIEFSTYSKEEE